MLAAHSLKLTPKSSLSHWSVNRPVFLSSLTVATVQKVQACNQIGTRPAISLSITNSLSLSSLSPSLSFIQTNNLHQVTACNTDTSYNLKFFHHFRANGYLTYQMTHRKVRLCAQQLCTHASVYVCVRTLTDLIHVCCRPWVAGRRYEFCPVLLCSGSDMD